MSMVNWILTHLPQLIFAIVLLNVIRAVFRAAKLAQEHKATGDETEEQRRVREIQERIRRKIAERRGQASPLAPAAEEDAPAAPLLRPARVPPLEPFGGPSRRLVIETMRRAEPREEPAPFDPGVLERQRELAAQILALDEARVATERRAAQVVEQRENASASSSTASAPHAKWIGDLHDRPALRRAFLLREVLGAPVALR